MGVSENGGIKTIHSLVNDVNDQPRGHPVLVTVAFCAPSFVKC